MSLVYNEMNKYTSTQILTDLTKAHLYNIAREICKKKINVMWLEVIHASE